jgi:uncharacterized protein (TIGR02246 family)
MEDIARVNQRFMQAVRSGDRTAFVALYTEDAVVMLPGRPALEGAAAPGQFFDGMKARGVTEVRLTTLELELHGDTAWERGRAESLRADGTPLGTAKYIVVWKRSDRGWRIHRDIMNPDA